MPSFCSNALPPSLPLGKDVVEAIRAIKSAVPRLKKYVLLGASKRAWTCWLVAASGELGLIGMIPFVFDDLDLLAQIGKQVADWSGHHPMIEDDITGANLAEPGPATFAVYRLESDSEWLADAFWKPRPLNSSKVEPLSTSK